jgi:hypothetical protein
MLTPFVDGVFGGPDKFGDGQLGIGGAWRDDGQTGPE